MPLFRCPGCNCIENTALSAYWAQRDLEKVEPRCSECRTGKWHGRFEKRSASGYHLGSDGFLWSPQEAERNQIPAHVRLIGVVP